MQKTNLIGTTTIRSHEGVTLRMRGLKDAPSAVPFKLKEPAGAQTANPGLPTARTPTAVLQTGTHFLTESTTRTPSGLKTMAATMRMAWGAPPPLAPAGAGTSATAATRPVSPSAYPFGRASASRFVASVAKTLGRTPIGRIGALLLMPSSLGTGSYIPHKNRAYDAPRQVNPARLLDETRNQPTAHAKGFPPPSGITIEEVPIDDTQSVPTTHDRPNTGALAQGTDLAPGFRGMPTDIGWGLHLGRPGVAPSIKTLEGYRPVPPNVLEGIHLKEDIYYPPPNQDVSDHFVRDRNAPARSLGQDVGNETTYRYQAPANTDPAAVLVAKVTDATLFIERFEPAPNATAQDKVNLLQGLLTQIRNDGVQIHHIAYTLKDGTHQDFERVTRAVHLGKEASEAILGYSELGQFFFRSGYFNNVDATPSNNRDALDIRLTYAMPVALTPEAITWNTHVIDRFIGWAHASYYLTYDTDDYGMIRPPGNIREPIALNTLLETANTSVPGTDGAMLDGSERLVRFEHLADLSVALGRHMGIAHGAEVELKRDHVYSPSLSGFQEKFFVHSGTPISILSKSHIHPIEIESLDIELHEIPRPYSIAHTHPFDVIGGQVRLYIQPSDADRSNLKNSLEEHPHLRRQHQRVIALHPDGTHISTFYGPMRTLGPMLPLTAIANAPDLKIRARIVNGIYTVRLSNAASVPDISQTITDITALAKQEGYGQVRFELDDPRNAHTENARKQILAHTWNNPTLSRSVFYDFNSGAEHYTSASREDLDRWLLTWTETTY